MFSRILSNVLQKRWFHAGTRTLLFTTLAGSFSCYADSTYVFTTLAGSPVRGSVDGPGPNARFFSPQGIAVDNAGNLLIADAGNQTVRKITPAGLVSTIAGMPGSIGWVDGTSSAARFASPLAIAVDANGNIFVVDGGSSTIRKITPNGSVATLAGSGSAPPGYLDATGPQARFNFPEGIIVDPSGVVYVADSGNHVIRRINVAGAVTTFAGSRFLIGFLDGTGDTARFVDPTGITLDAAGNIYVTEPSNSVVRKISPATLVVTLAGNGLSQGSADGNGRAAQFFFPRGIAADANGNLFVADSGNQTIRRVSSSGVVTTFAGSTAAPGTADGLGSNARFDTPGGVAIDANGNVFVADTQNHTIRKITPAGLVTTVAGVQDRTGAEDGSGSEARFARPVGVAVDSNGNAFIADTRNRAIRKVSPSGAVTTFAGKIGSAGAADGTGADARFVAPLGIAVDATGNLFVSDGGTTIRKITPLGIVTTVAGRQGVSGSADGPGSIATFRGAAGLAVDDHGDVFIAEYLAHTVRKLSVAGVVTTIAGSPGVSGASDGVRDTARFNMPRGIAVDENNNLFVADTRNNLVRKISPDGSVSTWAGRATVEGSADGIGRAAFFFAPEGIAVDHKGNVFVADTGNATIRKIDANALVTTIGGLVGEFKTADGKGDAARFDGPAAIAVDRSGALLIADSTGRTLRKGVSAASRLSNLSVRSFSGTASDSLIIGFNVSGAERGTMLIRGIGPTLESLGVTGVIVDPTLRVVASSGTVVAQNDNWDGASGIVAATGNVGAFMLPIASRDAAVLPTLTAGGYTAQIGGGTGIGLIEVYETDSSSDARLTNVSARTRSGSGSNTLIIGFVISGDAEKKVLVRAVGPTLAQFGVSDVLGDPRLTLFAGQTAVATNDNWSPELLTTFTNVGAFALAQGSLDSAMLVNLSPGAYTAQVTGPAGTAGVTLVEVYEVP